MKKSFGVLVLICFVLSACNGSAEKKTKEPAFIKKTQLAVDVEPYYFPFEKEPTIYKYDEVVKRPSGLESKSISYIKFGLLNDGSDRCYISSFGEEKNLEDSLVLIKKSSGFYILKYSFPDENGGRTEIENPKGMVFPFKRTLHDKSDYELNYITPVMSKMTEGNLVSSFSYKGLAIAPNSNSTKEDCIKLTAKTIIALKSLETQSTVYFEQTSVIYDKLGLGLYQIVTQEVDGSITRRTFSNIVDKM